MGEVFLEERDGVFEVGLVEAEDGLRIHVINFRESVVWPYSGLLFIAFLSICHIFCKIIFFKKRLVLFEFVMRFAKRFLIK